MELVGLAVGIVLGLDIRRAVVLGLVVTAPLLVAVALTALIWRRRVDRGSHGAVLAESVAAELRSGASLRAALESAYLAVDVGHRGPRIGGLSAEEIGRRCAADFPEIGAELEATVATGLVGGSSVADLFDEIASLALAHAEVRREIRVASASGRMTALVLIGAPLSYLAYQASSGRFGALLQHSEQRAVALLGMSLFVAGLALAALFLWKAR